MKNIKLYNVLFPFWMLLLLPPLWLIILPGNFLIDSLILLLSMWILKIENKKQWYKKHIMKIFAFGMLSDMLGAGYMLFMLSTFQLDSAGDDWQLTVPGLILSAIFIFVFNYFVTFRKADKKLRLYEALTFAIVTAPYTFLIPNSWMY